MNTVIARRHAIIVPIIVLALLGCLLIGWHAPQAMLLSYLAVYLFVLGPVLGSAALLMVHALTGGGWGEDLRVPWLAATRMLPMLAVLLIPILLGARWIYPWLHGPLDDPLIAQQRWYLNLPFFIVRAVVCFAFWLWLTGSIHRRLRHPETGGLTKRFAALGLIGYALTVTVAGVDWIMSLVPFWHSSAFGLIIGTGQLLGAAALAVWGATTFIDRPLPSPRLRDLGSLLLMLVLVWSYVVFIDYLTAWIADQPNEIAWYLPRLKTSWAWLGVFLLLFHLALPFAVLLSRRAKQQASWMRSVAALLLVAQAAYAIWLVLPGFRPRGFMLDMSDAAAWIGVVGLCWMAWTWQLNKLCGVREEAE